METTEEKESRKKVVEENWEVTETKWTSNNIII
jgi:hypothetical protein